MWKRAISNIMLAVCVGIAFFLIGCGRTDDENKENVVILTLGTFGNNREVRQQVELFNEKHEDYQIEIKEYDRYETEDGGGIERLQREIVSGNGPDIIDFGYGYSVTDILGKYTEDLFPYFEKMNVQGESAYFSNILQAFAYEDGLYAMPVSFRLQTFAVRSSLIGERESWNIEELMNCYGIARNQASGSLMLYPGETKKDVFGTFIMGSVENYVDWEQGACNFHGEDFKTLMEFANQFPDTLQITEDFSPMGSFAAGEALLYPERLSSIYDIGKAERVLGEPVTHIGYPVTGSDGTIIHASDIVLAINSTSEYKDIAWEFITLFLEEDFQSTINEGFPINKTALGKQLQQGMQTEYTENADGSRTPIAKSEIIFEGEEPIKIYRITQKEADTLLNLLDRASVSSAYDSRLHIILLEEVDSYFAGDKTLDEAAEIMQGRAQMYVGEL